MNKQIAIVEYRDKPAIGYRFNSDVELSLIEMYNWLREKGVYNERKDSLIIVNEVIDVHYAKNPIK
jgi:hypothetical protein